MPRVEPLLQAPSGPRAVVFLNCYSYMILRGSPDCIESADYIMCDGILMAVVVALWRRRAVRRSSFDMTGIAGDVFGACERLGLPVAVIGARSHEVERFVLTMRSAYPRIYVAFARDGYFSSEEWCQVAEAVEASNARVVLVGMGTPLQERFAAYLKAHLKGDVTIFTCGGFIHQASSGLYYYPRIVNLLHLRWLYRSLKEPYVRARLLREYVAFPFIFLRDLFARPPS